MFPALLGIGSILGTLAKLVLPNAKSIAEIFVGNKAAVEQYNAEADKAAQDEFSKEFSYPLGANRTSFDIAMDAVNRIPRPLFTISAWFLLTMPFIMPRAMTSGFDAMRLIPDALWNVILMILGFWFSSRLLEKLNLDKTPGMERKASDVLRGQPNRERDESERNPFSGNGLISTGAEQRDELLRLAGFSAGVLTKDGFTGSLPPSRSNGWRNVVAQRYAVSG